MSLLDTLYGQPAPIDGRYVRRVMNLEPDDSLQLERARKAECERRRRLRIKREKEQRA